MARSELPNHRSNKTDLRAGPIGDHSSFRILPSQQAVLAAIVARLPTRSPSFDCGYYRRQPALQRPSLSAYVRSPIGLAVMLFHYSGTVKSCHQ